MRRKDFHFELPEQLIAQLPLPVREASRLLCLGRDSGDIADRQFSDLPNLLRAGDLLVFNDTRVIPARLHGHKDSGGKVEVLVERVLNDTQLLAHVRASKSPKPGVHLLMEGGIDLEVEGREGDLFILRSCGDTPISELLDAHGHMPLPPYIQRDDQAEDRERYQTVYARKPGAVAAPTAGLHFSAELMQALEQKGIAQAYVTLHVGAGTFQPVRADKLEDHVMHRERVEVSQAVCDQIAQTHEQGGRVIAVGTTAVRSLESAARQSNDNGGELQPYDDETDIFIYPGYEFQVIDGMITNFHLPESTLLMLVAAFAGYDNVMWAYEHAVEQQYRFFSYGDAMLIL